MSPVVIRYMNLVDCQGLELRHEDDGNRELTIVSSTAIQQALPKRLHGLWLSLNGAILRCVGTGSVGEPLHCPEACI
jgi:hypothetical protein